MVVELISVGTEILLGNIVNTNAHYLSERCAQLGLSLYFETSVGDNESRLQEVLKTALSRSEVIILTGGLGPTADDLTKEVTAKTLGLALVADPHTREHIESYFTRLNRTNLPDSIWKQTEVIEGAIVIDNTNGTAPGLIVETVEGKRVILLPGPPNEMIPMFDKDIFPYLDALQPSVLYSSMVKICGIGESRVEADIKDLMDAQDNPTIAPYAKTGEVHLRVTASAPSEEEGKKLVKPVVKELKKRFGQNIYTTKETVSLEEKVVKLLRKNKLTLATAESCTGGLLTGRIVNVPGSSDVLYGGFITYADKAKKNSLGVSKDTLNTFGAVSEQTAVEMAEGACKTAKTNVSVSITGIAGPDGGTLEKPVGLVYIACHLNDNTTVREFHFKGNRQKIREYAVVNALDLLRRCILKQFQQ